MTKTRVRAHKRRTKKGKVVPVKEHTRNVRKRHSKPIFERDVVKSVIDDDLSEAQERLYELDELIDENSWSELEGVDDDTMSNYLLFPPDNWDKIEPNMFQNIKEWDEEQEALIKEKEELEKRVDDLLKRKMKLGELESSKIKLDLIGGARAEKLRHDLSDVAGEIEKLHLKYGSITGGSTKDKEITRNKYDREYFKLLNKQGKLIRELKKEAKNKK